MTSPDEQLPEDLKDVSLILQKSMEPPKGEDIPPLPDDLRDRLLGQYGKKAAAPQESAPSTVGLWEKIGSLFAQPAFAGSFAAVVLIAILGSFVFNQDNGGDNIRGGSGNPVSIEGTIVVMFQLSAEQEEAVKASEYFDESLLKVAKTPGELASLVQQEGASIVIDGLAKEIREEDGETISLPDEAGEIAEKVSELIEP